MIAEIGEIVLKLKFGGDEELRGTVNELGVLVEERRVDGDWISEEGVVSVLVDRMLAREGGIERVEIIRVLRCIVREFDHCKSAGADGRRHFLDNTDQVFSTGRCRTQGGSWVAFGSMPSFCSSKKDRENQRLHTYACDPNEW